MSYSGYGQHGAAPTSGYGASDPYGTAQPQAPAAPSSYASAPYQEAGYGQSGYGQAVSSGQYGAAPAPGQPGVVRVAPPPTLLSNQDFLAGVEHIRSEIRQLTTNVSEISVNHQRVLSDPTGNKGQLDALIANTQTLNTKIRDDIRRLEADALKDSQNGRNTTKDTQIKTLKGHFRSQLDDYQKEEASYRQRYQDQIAREYRIVNPAATDAEVKEAVTANWGDEGVFQTALKTNRTATANSVLGNVRARHNDIQNIEKNMLELAQIFQDLAVQVELQDTTIIAAEEETKKAEEDTRGANKHLDVGIKHARMARKLKWWAFGIIVAIIIILALILGLYFGLMHHNSGGGNNNSGTSRR